MVAHWSGLQGRGCWVSCKLRKHTVLTCGFCCPSALSPCAVTSTLPDWRIPVEIVPDSTSDLYNFQVSPMPSTSEGMCFWGLPACLPVWVLGRVFWGRDDAQTTPRTDGVDCAVLEKREKGPGDALCSEIISFPRSPVSEGEEGSRGVGRGVASGFRRLSH